MDRLIRQLKDEAAEGRFRTERLIYGKYEWGIKIAKPRDEHPFEPKFR
jgi:hypothetical protein